MMVLLLTLSLWCEIGWNRGSPVSSSSSLQCENIGIFMGPD